MSAFCIHAGLQSLRKGVHDIDPRWFRSMPSSKLASRIPHSGGVSHTLFLLECSTQSNPEGSNLASLAAIHRRCCANGYRPIWNQGNSHEWNFGSRLLCVLGPVLLKSPLIVAKSIVVLWDKMRSLLLRISWLFEILSTVQYQETAQFHVLLFHFHAL